MTAATGTTVAPFRLVRGSNDVVTSSELLADGPILFHFFPFAYTGSLEKGQGCEAQVCGFGALLDESFNKGSIISSIPHMVLMRSICTRVVVLSCVSRTNESK